MADGYHAIRLERSGAVATLTLDRPQRLNAINKQMLLELQHALDTVEGDPELRALVVDKVREGISRLASIFGANESKHARRALRYGAKSLSATSVPSRASGISRSQPSRPSAVIAWPEAANWPFAVTSRSRVKTLYLASPN